jgi:integrase
LTGLHFKPLHRMQIDQMTRRDVAARLTKIATEVSPITAHRARAALNALFTWAMQEGLAETNPVVGTRNPPTSVPGDRVLNDVELAAVWTACSGNGQFGKIVRLLILTGCRRAEIGGLRWTEIKPDGSLQLPPERTKNGRGHVLPLPQMALDIIKTVPQIVGRDLLFGVRGARGFRDWERKAADLDQRLGDSVKEWHLHDIRRSVATRMCDLGIAPHVVEQILNHVSGHKAGVAGLYNRSSYDREVKAALALWERYIGLIIDDDLYAAHQAYLTRGDDEARKKADEKFREAIAAGGEDWIQYVALIERGNVVSFSTAS